jgi:hypothetical protein
MPKISSSLARKVTAFFCLAASFVLPVLTLQAADKSLNFGRLPESENYRIRFTLAHPKAEKISTEEVMRILRIEYFSPENREQIFRDYHYYATPELLIIFPKYISFKNLANGFPIKVYNRSNTDMKIFWNLSNFFDDRKNSPLHYKIFLTPQEQKRFKPVFKPETWLYKNSFFTGWLYPAYIDTDSVKFIPRRITMLQITFQPQGQERFPVFLSLKLDPVKNRPVQNP